MNNKHFSCKGGLGHTRIPTQATRFAPASKKTEWNEWVMSGLHRPAARPGLD